MTVDTQTFVKAGVQATVYCAGPEHRNERERRAACLNALIEDHADVRNAHIVLDEDKTMVNFDNQKLIEYTRAAGCRDTVSYEHKRSHTDALLAIPDAIAWCWAKGGDWRRLIDPAVVNIRNV